MAWPTIAEYNAAFAAPEGRLLPASLAGARAKPGPYGTPLPLSGGFAYIYEVSLPSGRRKAVRCFSRDEPERRARARTACGKLAAALSRHPEAARFFVKLQWEEEGVRAGGIVAPLIVMDWAEGQVLGQYVEARYRDAGAMRVLREGLADLVASLGRAGIIHGDLQTGNIMVGPSGGIRLIDYDGLSFADDAAAPSLEAGHVHYQHPAWSASSPFERKDRFPSIVIDLSLRALELEPELYRKYSTGENILFSREDYLDPDASPAFRDVGRLPGLGRAAELLAGLCRSPIEILPTLADFQAEAYREGAGAAAAARSGTAEEASEDAGPAEAAGVFSASTEARKKRGPYAGPYRVLAGDDYDSLLDAVGEKVEVVGLIVSVKADGVTKYGKPYAFVNFGDWKSDEFKLTIWSEGLETFDEAPDSSWEGCYVSAIGLIDEPYLNERSYSTQVSITIQDSSQLRFIPSREASWRLGRVAVLEDEGDCDEDATAASRHRGGSNAELLGSLGAGHSASHGGSRRTTSTRPGQPSNAELLAKLASQRSTPPAPSPVTTPTVQDKDSGKGGCLIPVLLVLAGYFVVKILPRMLGW